MKKIVVWLCSSKDDELRELILDFSLELDGSVFLPHVTLLDSVEMEDTLPYRNAIRNLVKDWSPLEVTLDGIGFEDNLWRCLFYKAFPKKDLHQLHLELTNGLTDFGTESSDNFMPHLSLVYARMNILQQLTFLEKHKNILFPRTLIFDCIKIVHFVPEDVTEWEVLSSISFVKKDK